MSIPGERDPTSPQVMLEQYQWSRNQRLAVGLYVDARFRRVDFSLVLTKGYGKWLQHQWSESGATPLPNALGQACRDLVHGTTHESFTVASQLRADLSDYLVQACRAATCKSGKASDRLLTAGILDPGLWATDFDERVVFDSFCTPDRIAEQTGLTVVEAFAARDIAAAGQGWPIQLIAIWLLLADRTRNVATETRMAVQCGEMTEVCRLPPSDGLDDDLPNIEYLKLPGLGWIYGLLQAAATARGETPAPNHGETRIEHSHPNAPNDEKLKQAALPTAEPSRFDQPLLEYFENSWVQSVNAAGSEPESWSRISADYPALGQLSDPAIVATAIMFLSARIKQWHQRRDAQRTVTDPSNATAGSAISETETHTMPMYLIGEEPWTQLWQHRLDNDRECPWVVRSLPPRLSGRAVNSTLAAILSLMALDQTPGNLPSASGCELPRPLGRITPGSPTNWRQVILNMADYRPPAMKLRDAI